MKTKEIGLSLANSLLVYGKTICTSWPQSTCSWALLQAWRWSTRAARFRLWQETVVSQWLTRTKCSLQTTCRLRSRSWCQAQFQELCSTWIRHRKSQKHSLRNSRQSQWSWRWSRWSQQRGCFQAWCRSEWRFGSSCTWVPGTFIWPLSSPLPASSVETPNTCTSSSQALRILLSRAVWI